MKINKNYLLPLILQIAGIVLVAFNLDWSTVEFQELPFYGRIGGGIWFLGCAMLVTLHIKNK